MFEKRKLVVYDCDWQCVRVRCLKEHSENGGWTTIEGTVDNLEKLDAYMKAHTDSNDAQMRIYRVLNLLAAVRMGYSGQGLKGKQVDILVEKSLALVRSVYAGLVNFTLNSDEFMKQQEAKYAILYTQDPEVFGIILNDLHNRWRLHSSSAYRKELEWMIGLLKGIQDAPNNI